MSGNAPTAILEELILNAPGPFVSPLLRSQPSRKKPKRTLTDTEFDEIVANYWHGRDSDREKFISNVMDWSIWSFLHADHSHGQARNHEIRPWPRHTLISMLIKSAEKMRRDHRCKVNMDPVCWSDVQKHHHDVERSQIHMLAEELHESLIPEAIDRLIANQYISCHSDVWTLSTAKSRRYIIELKAPRSRRNAA